MKSSKFIFWLFIILALLLLTSGCSSDDDSVTEPKTSEKNPPEFSMKKLQLPSNMLVSTDEKVVLVKSFVQNKQDLSDFGCVFCPPENATKEILPNTWKYSWVEENLTKILSITEFKDRNLWQLYYYGTKDGFDFDNYKFMDAIQFNDQSSGHVFIFEEPTTQMKYEWNWLTVDQKYTLQWSDYCDENCKVLFSMNEDNSGEFQKLERIENTFILKLKVQWNNDGTGNWWEYENSQIKNSGHF